MTATLRVIVAGRRGNIADLEARRPACLINHSSRVCDGDCVSKSYLPLSCWLRIRHEILLYCLFLSAVRILYLAVALFVCGLLVILSARPERSAPDAVLKPRRIVSLAPAITETLYMLGLGDRVAGVTSFCAWPPEAALKPKIGGFREVNLEAIARTGADLVILPRDMAHFRKAMEDLGIPVRLFDYQSLSGFLKDMQALGKLCGQEAAAKKLVADFEGVSLRQTGKDSPSVLFALANPHESQKTLGEMTIIGADGFYNDIITAAGGHNAYTGSTPFPRLSLEAVLALDPDVIVIGASEFADPGEIAKKWRGIAQLKGAQGRRLLVLDDPADTVPGPRSLDTIRKITGAIDAARGAQQ